MRPDPGLDEALALVRRLNYSHAGDVDETIPADWGPLVRQLLETRANYGPIPATDPIALLASSTRAAHRTAPPTGAAAGYQLVANATAARQTSTATSDQDVRDLYRLSFEAVHGLRTRTQDPAAARWLYAAERSLDAALVRPVEPGLTATALAAWQHALAQLPPGDATRWAAVATQRTILREAATVVAVSGTLDSGLAASLHEQLLTVVAAFNPIPNPRVPVPPLTREARLLGQVGADLVRARTEPPALRMSALLASHFGQVGIASRLLDVPQATHAADRLESLTLDWITGRIQPRNPPTQEDAPRASKTSSHRQPEQPSRPAPPTPTPIEGDLSDAGCAQLARDRDRGRLAASAIAGDESAIALISQNQDLQVLVDTGRDATAQLALAALPLAEQFVRKALPTHQDDMRADQHVRLLVAAQAYDPERGSWYSFARSWLGHDSGYYDSAGIAGKKSGRHVFAAEAALYADLQRDATLNEVAAAAGLAPGFVDNLRLLRSATPLDVGSESVGPTVASAEDIYLARHERRTLYDAIDELPSGPAEAIRARLDGLTFDQIAEQMHSSPASVSRRIREGIEQLRARLLESQPAITTANLAAAAAALAHRPTMTPTSSPRPSVLPEPKAPGLA